MIGLSHKQMSQQKEELRSKIRKLEQQIVERTRNYMYQHSLSKSRRDYSASNVGTQTEGFDENGQRESGHISNSPVNSMIYPKKLSFESPQKRGVFQRWNSNNEKIELCDCLSKQQLAEKVAKLGEQKMENEKVLHQTIEELENKLNSSNQQTKQNSQCSKSNYEEIQSLVGKIQILEESYDYVRQALVQSEQANYNLRLKIQHLEVEDRKKLMLNKEHEEIINYLNLKIEQMEVMKKQYLRAYSKVKDEKEYVEIRLLELQKSPQIQDASRRKLERITENSDEDLVNETIRYSNTDNSFVTIKTFLERSLLETNRKNAEKLISASLTKLETYQKEQQFKISDIHENYKSLMKTICQEFTEETNLYHKQISSSIVRIICKDRNNWETENQLQSESEYQSEKEREKKSRQKKEREENWQLLCKLNIYQSKWMGLQHDYNELIESLAKQEEVNVNDQEILAKFKQIMSKGNMKEQSSNQADFIEKLACVCERVFEIVSHFPIGDHGNIYFVPKNFDELNETLNVLLRFSQNYDHITEEKDILVRSNFEKVKVLMIDLIRHCEVTEQDVSDILRRSFSQDSEIISTLMAEIAYRIEHQKEEKGWKIGKVIKFGAT